MALKDTETARILKRRIPTKDKSFLSNKSKLSEFGSQQFNPDNSYQENSSEKPTQLVDSVNPSGRSGGVRPSIRTFTKGLEMFGVSIPVGDRYEDTIKRDSIFNDSVIGELNKNIQGFKSFKKSIKSFSDNPLKSISDIANIDQEAKLIEYRAKAYGKQKTLGNPAAKVLLTDKTISDAFDGPIKGGKTTRNVNRANMTPYGDEGKNTDLVDFRFKDVHNNKFINFSAILSGITDTITPEYASERYLGRPESVYIYQGVSRAIGFNFEVYPTTRQELPVLWEKLNYLVGMCYPNWVNAPSADPDFKPLAMISPMMELTIGDMYRNTPGFLSTLSLVVQDGSTWEFEKDLQLPHYIQVTAEFTYIGRYLPNARGKHFELNWLSDKSGDGSGTFPVNGTAPVTDLQPDRSPGKSEGGMEWINPKNKDVKGKMVENIGSWGKFIGLGD
jgi:hypothetical protein